MKLLNFFKGNDLPKKSYSTKEFKNWPTAEYYLICKYCGNLQDEFSEELECQNCHREGWAIKNKKGELVKYNCDREIINP